MYETGKGKGSGIAQCAARIDSFGKALYITCPSLLTPSEGLNMFTRRKSSQANVVMSR